MISCLVKKKKLMLVKSSFNKWHLSIYEQLQLKNLKKSSCTSQLLPYEI